MLHYHTEGEGNVLVLIHGFPLDSTAWRLVLHYLPQPYKLIIPDLPGAGQSPAAEPLTVTRMAEAVLEVLDKEQVKKAVVAGHSMGGYTALEMARLRPKVFAGLSMVHSSARADNEEKKENRRKAARLIGKGVDGQEMFLRGAAPNMFAPPYADAHLDKINDFIAKGMALPGQHLIAFYEALEQRNDNTEVIKNATFPVQWIIGGSDQVVLKSEQLQQVALAKINDVQVYRHCGHSGMTELPERLAKDLSHFADYSFSL